ncbi:hypothetical protein IMCC9480_2623 [Oxalobacteraceae bacterium IMCC9480]|nr:hypothetical protein IMCC9480_2623 [Oxalobacteraceae bacterium IMCC9480]
MKSFLKPNPVAPSIGRLMRNLPPDIDAAAMAQCICRIWDSLLIHFSDPVQVTMDDDARIITFMGAIRYVDSLDDTTIRVAVLMEDGVNFNPVTNVGIDLPVRLTGAWLEDFLAPWWASLPGCLDDGTNRAAVMRELQRTVAQATHWRRLRHALRDTLRLDTTLLVWMRPGRHRLLRFVITDLAYNRAVSQRHRYEQIMRECPKVLWLYNLMDELQVALPPGDVVAALRSTLLAEHRLKPAAWRYLLRCDHRHFLHLIDYIGPDGSTTTRWRELGHWLRWVVALDRRTPVPPELTRLFAHDAYAGMNKYGRIAFRTAEVQPGTMRAILDEAQRRQVAGTLDAFILEDLVAVITWLQTVQPTLDANQIRRGWKYLARSADGWQADMAGRASLATVAWSSLLSPMTHGSWCVLPITDAWALHEEALAMRHCADGYLAQCLDGSWRLFSVRTLAGKRMATLGIELNGLSWRIGDLRRFANGSVSPALRALAQDITSRYGVLWSLIEGETIDRTTVVVPATDRPVTARGDDPNPEESDDGEDVDTSEGDEDESACDVEESGCPICSTAHDDQPCSHAVLLYDRTFSDVGGGALYEAFETIVTDVETEIRHACEFGSWRIEVDDAVASLPMQIGPWSDPESFDTAFWDLIGEHRRALREMILDRLSDGCPLVTRTSWYFDQGGPGMSSAYYSYWADEPDAVALWLAQEFKPRMDSVCVTPSAVDTTLQTSRSPDASVDHVRSVVVYHQDRFHMTSDWIDEITISRTRRKRFTVRARKHVESFDGKAGRRWLTLDKESCLHTARQLRGSLEQAAQLLDVELDWERVVSGIAQLDWLMAAVFAKDNELPLPQLPCTGLRIAQHIRTMLGGRRLSRLTVGVEWGDDIHTLPLRMYDWIGILSGHTYCADSSYWYEGKRFTSDWHFDSNSEDALTVGYDDGGVGYQGALSGATIAGPVWCGYDIARLLAEAYLDRDCNLPGGMVEMQMNFIGKTA